MLAVAPAARGAPARRWCASACGGRATPAGRALVLSTHARMHAAHRFYRRLGSVRAPERDGRPVPELAPLWLFTHDLTLPAAPSSPARQAGAA